MPRHASSRAPSGHTTNHSLLPALALQGFVNMSSGAELDMHGFVGEVCLTGDELLALLSAVWATTAEETETED
jgi:hypothetical protein